MQLQPFFRQISKHTSYMKQVKKVDPERLKTYQTDTNVKSSNTKKRLDDLNLS